MAKIMLVEDDTNLSEIYQARLAAEGYQIVSAHDGEEALALAAKEKPDLIISDVMMPKISGFEMLDILRNTDGLKTTKVIMLTALGQAEDKTRAEGLGADRYLVKSQVTLEDIVKAAQELLNDTAPAATVAAASAPAPAATPPATAIVPPVPQPTPAAAIPVAAPPATQTPAANPAPVATAPTSANVPVIPTPASPVTPIPVAAEPPAQPIATPQAAPASTIPVQPTPAQPVATPTTPAIPVQAPTAAPLIEPVDANTAADDKLVTNAVEDLLEGVASKSPAAPETQTAPAATSQLPAPTPEPAPPEKTIPKPTPATEPAETTTAPAEQNVAPNKDSENSSNDNVAIAHKKIITPIVDDPTFKKPDLNSLLAAEEHKNPGTINQPIVTGDAQGQAAAKAAAPAPHQPGHVIAPDGATAGPNAGGGIDPNSIAL